MKLRPEPNLSPAAPLRPIVPAAQAVLDFWFGDPPTPVPRKPWFSQDADFDRLIAERFGATLEAALSDHLVSWGNEPQAVLARIVLLDQFTRNVFRGTARAFAGDDRALAAAQALVAAGGDRTLSGLQRWFVYLPFEHAEDLAMQQQSLELFDVLAAEQPALAEAALWAHKHQEVIQRFGRYPHRNTILGRQSTPEELAFLAQPGSSF